jgi:hypothetical protein
MRLMNRCARLELTSAISGATDPSEPRSLRHVAIRKEIQGSLTAHALFKRDNVVGRHSLLPNGVTAKCSETLQGSES